MCKEAHKDKKKKYFNTRRYGNTAMHFTMGLLVPKLAGGTWGSTIKSHY